MTKAIAGKNNFLFLSEDSNRVFDQVAAKYTLSPSMLRRWINIIDDRVDFCKNNGCDYFIFIAPNKHCVYREFLPDGSTVSEKRIARQLEAISSCVFYPCNTLREYTNCLTYQKLDTHWNEVGCCVAWNEFIRTRIGGIGLDISNVEEFSTGPGDLGEKIDKTMRANSYRVVQKITSKNIWDNFLSNRGRTRIFKNLSSNNGRVVIFGDSFCNVHMERIADYFSETYFFHTHYFCKDIVEQLSPDVVINENVERFFYRPYSSLENSTSHFLQHFTNGKYGKTQLVKFINIPWNEVFHRDTFDKMSSTALEFIDIFNHFNCNDTNKLLRAAPGQSPINRLNELLTYKNIPLLYYEMCVLQMRTNDFQGALDSITTALDSSPKNALYLFSLSKILSKLNMPEPAIQKVQEAIAVQDDHPGFFHHLGNLLIDSGDLEGAKEAQEKAIALNASLPGPHIQLSRIYNRLGDLDQAIQKAQDAIAAKNDNPNFYHHLGNLLLNSGDLKGAKEAQEKAIALNASLPGPHIQLSRIYNRLGDLDHAIQKAQDAIAAKDDNPNFYYHLGNLLLNSGDVEGANEAQDKAIALSSSLPGPHL